MPRLRLLVLNLSAVDPLMSSLVSGNWCQAGRNHGICHLAGVQVLRLHLSCNLFFFLFHHRSVNSCPTAPATEPQDGAEGKEPGQREQACLNPTKVFNAVSLSPPTSIFVGLRITLRNLIPQQQVGASASVNDVCLCRFCSKPQTCSRCFSSSPRGSWDWLPPPVTQCRMSADGKWMLAQLKELDSP